MNKHIAKLYKYLLKDRKWRGTWKEKLLFRVDYLGVSFEHIGDEIIWIWPWQRNIHKEAKFLSIGFSGTGEFGGSYFRSLREIENAWDDFLL